MKSKKMHRIVSISGTSRPNNFTSLALGVVNEELASLGHSVEFFDARHMRFDFPGSPPTEDARRLKSAVEKASGVVLATPEYHGSFAAMTKLIIENMGFPSILAGKPIALVGVAAGRIGAIKSLEQLRGICAHVGAIVLPGATSIAGVQSAFDTDGNCVNEAIESTLRSVAVSLTSFIDNFVCPKYALEEMVRGVDDSWTASV